MSDLTSRIRAATFDIRRQKIPLGDLIPMMQEAADRIEADEALMRTNLEALDSVEWHGGGSCWIVDAEKIEQAITALRKRLESSNGL